MLHSIVCDNSCPRVLRLFITSTALTILLHEASQLAHKYGPAPYVDLLGQQRELPQQPPNGPAASSIILCS